MEPTRRNGSTEFTPYEPDAPQAATDVSSHEVATDMSRKAPPNGHDTEELSIALHKLTSMLEEQTEVLTKVAGAVARPNGWKGPSGIWTMVGIGLIIVTIIGEFIRLEDKVAYQTGAQVASQATMDKMSDTLTRMDERGKNENVSSRMNSMEEYVRDIREDLAAHGLLNKVGSYANTRNR